MLCHVPRRKTRQELQADAREPEQLELGRTWNGCPDEGLCAWCLEQLDARPRFALAREERSR